MKHFENYSTAARAVIREMELKVSTADLRRSTFDPAWVYLNRIGRKVRILTERDAIHNGGTIRNAIKITWNPDRYAREHVESYVHARLALIVQQAQHGSCHPAIRCSEIGEVLAGAHEGSARWNKGAAILYTDSATWAKQQAKKI